MSPRKLTYQTQYIPNPTKQICVISQSYGNTRAQDQGKSDEVYSCPIAYECCT